MRIVHDIDVQRDLSRQNNAREDGLNDDSVPPATPPNAIPNAAGQAESAFPRRLPDAASNFNAAVSHAGAASLASALRRARTESAERSDVLHDLRDAALSRLEALREQLKPVFDAVPDTCDIFDPGIVPGERPRMFVDMIAFVEMARDRRTYRFEQDTRHGRVLLAESDRIEAIVKSVTDYVAHRLIEREKALASIDEPFPLTPPSRRENRADARAPVARADAAPQTTRDERRQDARQQTLRRQDARRQSEAQSEPERAAPYLPKPRRGWGSRIYRGFLFFIEVLGSATFFGILAAGLWWAWQTYARQIGI